jgi:hypothetical protein
MCCPLNTRRQHSTALSGSSSATLRSSRQHLWSVHRLQLLSSSQQHLWSIECGGLFGNELSTRPTSTALRADRNCRELPCTGSQIQWEFWSHIQVGVLFRGPTTSATLIGLATHWLPWLQAFSDLVCLHAVWSCHLLGTHQGSNYGARHIAIQHHFPRHYVATEA